MVVAPAAPQQPPTVASPRTTRVLSLIALGALAVGLFVLARGSYFALTDSWVAPMQLSPDSREVVTLRMQAAKEKEERARFESEITSTAAEIAAIELGIARLRTL